MIRFGETSPCDRSSVFILACIVTIVNVTIELQSTIFDTTHYKFAVAPRLFKEVKAQSDRSLKQVIRNGTKPNFSFKTFPELIENLTSPVLLTTVNFAFTDFLHNLLFSIWRIRLQPNIVIICEDKESYVDISSYQKNLDLKINVVMTHTDMSPTLALKYRTPEYGKLVNKRPRYVQMLINKGTDVFFIDTDIVLIGDPFPFFNGTAVDVYVQKELMQGAVLCAGFFYMKSNRRTRKVVSDWIQYLDKHPEEMDQDGFNKIFPKSNISMSSLPPEQFSSGHVFMSSKTPWFERLPPLIEVHANFIVGKDKKKKMLKDAGLWFVQY